MSMSLPQPEADWAYLVSSPPTAGSKFSRCHLCYKVSDHSSSIFSCGAFMLHGGAIGMKTDCCY